MTTNFFDESSPYLAHPLLTDERSSAEADQLVTLLNVGQGARVLDIGCGFGRHCIELTRRGLKVAGIDPSATMRSAASDRARSEGFDISFAPALDQSHDGADGAIAMFTTIGQVGPNGDSNESIVAGIRRALRPGASLVIEVPQKAAAVDLLVPTDTFGAGANRTEIARAFDADTNRVTEHFVVTTDDAERSFHLEYRLFDQVELGALILDAGFVNARFGPSLAGVIEGAPLQSSDPTMVVVTNAAS